MQYRLLKRRGQKNLRMHFNSKGELIVSCPYYTSQKSVDEFIRSNRVWIEKQMKNNKAHSFETGDILYFAGKEYNLVVNDSEKDSVQTVNNIMIVYTNDRSRVRKLIQKFYQQYLLQYITQRIVYWCDCLDLEVPEIKICNASSRWGCCYKTKHLIKISLMTAVLEEKLIDMIALHEVCHLVYMNHQSEFWMLMENLMPDLKERRLELKRFGKKGVHLHLF